MADSSEQGAGKPEAAGAIPKTKGIKGQEGRVVESQYLQDEKNTKKVSLAAKGEKPPEGRKTSTLPRSQDKSMSKKSSQLERKVAETDKPTLLSSHGQKNKKFQKKKWDLQERMEMMESQTLQMKLLSVKMENTLALREEKEEKDLTPLCHEKERLQREALELQTQLLLRQKQQELVVDLEAQIQLLSTLQSVIECFKPDYKILGRALGTMQHMLPMQAVHLRRIGLELLDDLEPVLMTTLQLLSDLSICSPGASKQVKRGGTQQPGTELNHTMKELKDLVTELDLELRRLVSELVELFSEASKEAALMNQEV